MGYDIQSFAFFLIFYGGKKKNQKKTTDVPDPGQLPLSPTLHTGYH